MIDSALLNTGMELGPLDAASLIEAWRQAHFAAQAAAEVGKSWAVEKPDDSHSSLVWVAVEEWHGLEGVPAAGARPLRARLLFESLELSLVDGQGGAVARLSLPGHTLEEALTWIGSACERELGPRRQVSRPAPDLPDHRLARGTAFETPKDGLVMLAQTYAATAGLLSKLREALPVFDEPRCWPHHFDLATLAVVATDDDGAMERTIGVGVTPPDSVESAGYWYVSPWMRDDSEVAPRLPELSIGRWIDRDALPMAVLPLSQLSSTPDGTAALGAFVAEAVNACMQSLRS